MVIRKREVCVLLEKLKEKRQLEFASGKVTDNMKINVKEQLEEVYS
jgi:hypothetical protein